MTSSSTAKCGSSNIMLLHSAPQDCSQLFSQYGMRRQQIEMKDSFVTTSSPAIGEPGYPHAVPYPCVEGHGVGWILSCMDDDRPHLAVAH